MKNTNEIPVEILEDGKLEEPTRGFFKDRECLFNYYRNCSCKKASYKDAKFSKFVGDGWQTITITVGSWSRTYVGADNWMDAWKECIQENPELKS